MKITIEAYTPDWAIQFRQLKQELSAILHSLNPEIEHFGSTSVSGLAAKPVIDIMVGLEQLEDLDKAVPPMLDNGYIYYEVYNAAMPERRLFIRLKDKKDLVHFQEIYKQGDELPHDAINELRFAHIHVWPYGSSEWIRHVAFRDYLRSHPEVREEYGALKMRLSEKDWKDGNQYNDAKNNFIKTMEAKAIEWYRK